MKPKAGHVILLLPVLGMGGCGAADDESRSDSQVASGTRNVVRQIDHILIESTNSDELFSLLSDTFQFPVAWPMSEYGNFASGGIAIGNVNLEVLKSVQSGAGEARSRFVGFALEPEPLGSTLPELQARGVPHGAPAPYTSRGPDGSARTLWTTVGLPSVSHNTAGVFLCEYAHDVPARRRQLREQLRSLNGGPLSALSVREVVYGAVDAEAMQKQWQALLDPVEPSSPGVWSVGEGPAIRVTPAAENGIRGVVIYVASLEQARKFLAERGLLGTAAPSEVTLASPDLEGLDITLVEESGA